MRQSHVLCVTDLLANQHLQVAKDRCRTEEYLHFRGKSYLWRLYGREERGISPSDGPGTPQGKLMLHFFMWPPEGSPREGADPKPPQKGGGSRGSSRRDAGGPQWTRLRGAATEGSGQRGSCFNCWRKCSSELEMCRLK